MKKVNLKYSPLSDNTNKCYFPVAKSIIGGSSVIILNFLLIRLILGTTSCLAS